MSNTWLHKTQTQCPIPLSFSQLESVYFQPKVWDHSTSTRKKTRTLIQNQNQQNTMLYDDCIECQEKSPIMIQTPEGLVTLHWVLTLILSTCLSASFFLIPCLPQMNTFPSGPLQKRCYFLVPFFTVCFLKPCNR